MKPESRQRLWQCAVLLAGCILCALVNLPAAGILLVTGTLLLVIGHRFEKKRLSELQTLCNEIDRILHGAQHIQLDQYREGELGVLTAEIGKMTVRLREQNAALLRDRTFMKEALEDMSHQLRTPLTTSMLLLETLRRNGLSPQERSQTIQELMTMLTRMQWMLETLLGFSRLDAGAVTFQPETFPLRELVRASLEPLEISLELKGVDALVSIPGEPVITADRGFLREALTNILKNCMEHTPEGGRITISGEETALYTRLVISDTGDGIAPEDLPHIFERFYRGKAFSRNGYGIGLAFARRIITSQNGSLTVRNAEPDGAEFDLRLYRTSAPQ